MPVVMPGAPLVAVARAMAVETLQSVPRPRDVQPARSSVTQRSDPLEYRELSIQGFESRTCEQRNGQWKSWVQAPACVQIGRLERNSGVVLGVRAGVAKVGVPFRDGLSSTDVKSTFGVRCVPASLTNCRSARLSLCEPPKGPKRSDSNAATRGDWSSASSENWTIRFDETLYWSLMRASVSLGEGVNSPSVMLSTALLIIWVALGMTSSANRT